jgi:hypothetical protein
MAKSGEWSREAIENIYIDARRRMDVAERDLAARPDRDLETQKRFAALRADPWKLTLATEMAFFARSSDVSVTEWPWDAFSDALASAGQELPGGMRIDDAVNVVIADLIRLAPATPKKDAWYDANIARPMGERLAATGLGASELPSDDESLGAWLRARSRDIDLDSMSVLRADVQAAPARLEAKLTRLDALPESDEVIRRRFAVEGALKLARQVAADAGSMEAFRLWLRAASEDVSDAGAPVKILDPWLLATGVGAGNGSNDARARVRDVVIDYLAVVGY